MKRFWFACCALSGCLFLGLSLAVLAQEKPKGAAVKAAEKQPAAKKSGPAVVATVREATAVVDLRKLETLKDATFDISFAATRLEGFGSSDVKSAAEFYLAQLTKLGWQPSAEPYSITADYAQASLEKNGYVLSLTALPTGMPGKVMVSVINLGNLHPRELPRVADAKLIFGGRASTMYVTPKKVAEVAAETRKLLKAAGWAEYAQPFSQQAEIPDQEMFELRQRGVSMTAYISVSPGIKGETMIQYSTRMLRQELPAPANAEALEFDDTRPYLRCQIPGEMQAAIDFFSKAFPEIGFSEKRSVNASGDGAFLVFRSPEKDVAFAELKKLDGDKIDATVRVMTAAVIEAANNPKPVTETKPVPRKELYDPVIALPKEATGISIPTVDVVQFQMAQSVSDATKELRALYKAEKWREDAPFSVFTPLASVLELNKGQVKLTVLVVPGDDDKSSEVTLSGSQLAKKKSE
ncbi:MAG: hypothetical protein H7062_05795 [Candidatus Saccharimonas sp.]|nr:hypothetical protein [Planctomycetaceae bacterium]